MARASIPTLLPLDTWAAILGISPWEFNQCAYPFPKSAQCSDVIYQFPWQKDHLSREEIAEAISDAESMLAYELLYWPAPKYFTGEVLQYPRPHQNQLWGYAGDIRGDLKTVQLKWHKVISGGQLKYTSIGTITGGDLVKLDLDADGVYETFQATITDAAIGSVNDPYELALYFVSADRHGEPLSEAWRIRPVRVEVSGNTATITGHRTLLINPELEYAADATKINPAVDANYVTSLACLRVFTDSTSTNALPYQGVAEWKTVPGCSENCTFEVAPLCLGEDTNDTGRVFASFGSPCDWPFANREPDRLNVNYLAGLSLVNGQMDDVMARIVTYLSVSLLANEKCGCDRSNRTLAMWRSPVTRFQDRNGAGADAYATDDTQFPMTKGGQYALKRVRRMKDLESVSI
jgi:hypothetical protein